MRILSVVSVASLLALSACGGEPPRLEIGALGITMDGVQGSPAPYFSTELCSVEGEHDVTINAVRVEEGTGRGAEFGFVVNWPGGDDAVEPGGYAELLPPGFVPAKGSTGTVNECGSGEQADVAILFPELADEAVGVKRIVVAYESEGRAGTVTGDVAFTHCGTNQVAGPDGSCSDRTGG